MPALIHFIWVGENPVPAQFAEKLLPQWQEVHGDKFEIKVWKEEDLETLELRNGNIIKDKALNPGLRADFLRLELLFQKGGIYADIDMTCERSLEPLLSLKASFITSISYTNAFEVNNGLLIARPGSPAVSYLIDQLTDSFQNAEKSNG